MLRQGAWGEEVAQRAMHTCGSRGKSTGKITLEHLPDMITSKDHDSSTEEVAEVETPMM